jgi:hypothetical protein
MTREAHGWTFYQTRDLAVVPYMEGSPVHRDGVLLDLYRRTRDEGKIETVFCGDKLNFDSFVAFFEKRKTLQILCRVENDRTLRPAGYCWIDMPRGVDGARAVMCGFCFFREATRVAVDLGKLGLAYWFEDMRADVIHGVLLESNKPGIHYALKLGFKDVCVVPEYLYAGGHLVGAQVMILRREEFMPGFDEWLSRQIPVEIPE